MDELRQKLQQKLVDLKHKRGLLDAEITPLEEYLEAWDKVASGQLAPALPVGRFAKTEHIESIKILLDENGNRRMSAAILIEKMIAGGAAKGKILRDPDASLRLSIRQLAKNGRITRAPGKTFDDKLEDDEMIGLPEWVEEK